MVMQSVAKKASSNLRVFRIGILGASVEELSAISRVFSVTHYRTRRYEAVRLPLTLSKIPQDIDIVVVGQSSGSDAKRAVGSMFLKSSSSKETRKPVVYMMRNVPTGTQLPEYAIRTPLNPAKFLRLLDQYTIKELNYFPEFEIGRDNGEMKGEALAGLLMLKRSVPAPNRSAPPSRNLALVVDDSLAVRKQMEIEFGLIRQPVDLVDSAEAAMQKISANRYSIIFMDVVMSGMDGYAACKKIKRSPLNKNTPVILLTSRSSSFDKFKGALAGCDAYLVKPVNHNDFENIFMKYASVNKGDKVNGGE